MRRNSIRHAANDNEQRWMINKTVGIGERMGILWNIGNGTRWDGEITLVLSCFDGLDAFWRTIAQIKSKFYVECYFLWK